jgi:molybdate transport system permease protein
VSLARALASEPQLLLLDEPFSGLDSPVRHRLGRELRRLQLEDGLSTVIVTHDPEEAALLADEIIVIDEGRLLQAGSRETVFRTPSSPQVAALLGIANTHEGRLLGADRLLSHGVEILASTALIPDRSEVAWSVRPERILIDPNGHYAARILDEVDLGAVRELTIALEGALELTLRTNDAGPPDADPQSRGDLRVSIDPADIAVWPLRGEIAAGTVPGDA